MPEHPLSIDTPFAWTTERVDKMISLHNEGRSAAQVAKVIGVSRNAVIGKLSRLRHAGHPGIKINPPGQRQKATIPKGRFTLPVGWKKKSQAKPVAKEPPKKYPAPKPTAETNVLTKDRGADQCRFIEADFAFGNGAEQYMCGAKVWEPGQNYCRYHYKQCVIIEPPSEKNKYQRYLAWLPRQYST